ncbi:BREX system P-loop protein BrxC [Lacticaseibacillus kribbianus]|uniref:BREX system P-loop protein BrxC n=1 Tax=Lacticaseibacillus kribbianus TaxID=2926292 RepID=UPI001CD1C40A|nr:BREX system P-loop protein BrxC [Lacticaseibacillus kribbianus]
MTTKIRDVFSKSIDRNIQGVIKVGQEDNARVELDEYVVTNELQRQFATFFSAYTKSLDYPTDDMGVWISGFFGSGKSHFLKILSYILDNRQAGDRSAVEYFKDKIKDPLVYAQMQKAADADTDVILFNIDSKAMSGEKHEADVILRVFLQVFNEKQGYSDKNLWLADLERQLDADDRYEAFKTAFQSLETSHQTWVDSRDQYSMKRETIRDALVQIGFMSAGDAQGFVNSLFKPYQINIEGFAQLVNTYIQKTGRRVAFLVDEVGQFIGDSVQRMLNLQTVVEELGLATHGKAWVIVTSQQAIGDVTTNVNGQDFSKIQGRFKTRIALSSANVDEVIKRRVLEKTPVATAMLEDLYQSNSAALNNAIDFDEGVTREKFGSAATFAANYPFVPYQFNLLQAVLTAVRTHGSDGKHLSEGERSMLSIFQESAIRVEDAEAGKLVPFSLFFEGLAQFLDHTHNIVIQHALGKPTLNPNKEGNPFAVQVLKTLFMVKYVDSFKATLNNVVTLLIDDVNVDRLALTDRTKAALKALIKENLVEEHFGEYVFLTDDEQDINNGIQREVVQDSAILGELQTYLFSATKAISDVYSYPRLNNRYIFHFNRMLDELTVGRANQALTLRVITPQSDDFGDEGTYARLTSAPEVLVIALPDDRSYLDLISRKLKINQYMQSTSNNQEPRFRLLLDDRMHERERLDATAKEHALNALESAQIYLGGAPQTSKRDFAARLEEAEKALIDNNYRDLSYIEAAKNDHDITQLFSGDDGLLGQTENDQAVQEVQTWLQMKLRSTQHVALKDVIDRFKGIPYGYTEQDTEWLVAALLRRGIVKISYNGEAISPMQVSPKEITDYLTKKTYADRIAIQVRKEVRPHDLKQMRKVAAEVFNKKTFSVADADAEIVASELRDKVQSDLKTLNLFSQMNPRFPGRDLIETGVQLMKSLLETKDSDAFIAAVLAHFDDLLDWHTDLEDTETKDFYLNESRQGVWKSALRDREIYEKSQDYLADPRLQEIAASISAVLKTNRVKGNIQKLKDLDAQFDDLFNTVFDAEQKAKLAEIDEIKQSGLDYLERSSVADTVKREQSTQYTAELARIRHEADEAVDLALLNGTTGKATARYNRLTNYIEQLQKTQPVVTSPVSPKPSVDDTEQGGSGSTAPDPTDPPVGTPTDDQLKVPSYRIKAVRVREVSDGNRWQIKSESDIDKYMQQMRAALVAKLQDADEIDLNF